MVLQFNRGTSDPDGDGNFDCIPAVDNFQVFHFITPMKSKSIENFSRSYRLTLVRLGVQCKTYLPSSNSKTEFFSTFSIWFSSIVKAVIVRLIIQAGNTLQFFNLILWNLSIMRFPGIAASYQVLALELTYLPKTGLNNKKTNKNKCAILSW